MAFRLHNTLTKFKQEFTPLDPPKLKMYNCGPTVYNYATIGNFRAFILADLLRRYAIYKGYEVTQVMNITDVGHLTEDAEDGTDKLEVAAKQQKLDPWEIAKFYEKAFFDDIDTLRISRADHYPRATEHVPEMIDLVQKLLDRGYAYVSNQCVYYDISKFPDYGRLSGNTLEDLIPGARLAINPDKKDPRDFALWVTDPTHIMKWDSPWGSTPAAKTTSSRITSARSPSPRAPRASPSRTSGSTRASCSSTAPRCRSRKATSTRCAT